MTEKEELEMLRAFKKTHDDSYLNRAFGRLETLLDAPFQQRCDTVMSVRSLRILAEALIALKDEVLNDRQKDKKRGQ